MKTFFLSLRLLCSISLFCSTPPLTPSANMQDFEYGKNRFTTVIDGVSREYYVHVPLSYKDNTAVPMVFMLHGTSGNGETFYNAHGWVELSEKENFIAVFPSSMRYKIIDLADGPKTTTKWNTTPDANWVFQEGQQGQDDIKFLRKIITEMQDRFKIDATRIYLNGFSNGGQMAAKCSIEMSDVIAAVCQNAGSFYLDTTYIPKRKLPMLYEVGNTDYGPGNTGPSIPMMYFDSLISNANLAYINGKHYRVAQNHIHNFNLKEEHVITGDSNIALLATYQPVNPGLGTGYEFKYILVKNLGHAYPNGLNNKLDAPKTHWDWMKQFKLENAGSATTHTLTVMHGYGSGQYEAGDTVHIWAKTPTSLQTFDSWSGDAQFTDYKGNWHTTFVMPERDATITAEFIDLPADLEYKKEQIQGLLSKTTVYSYFPPKEKIKGVVWFFSGSNGRGVYWTNRAEQSQMTDMMVANGYGIITMDAEEVTQQIDLNNSGSLEFNYTPDTVNNPDMVNVKLVKAYFQSKGLFNNETPQISCGFSSGAGFAEILAATYKWRASLSHNTGGIEFVAEKSPYPHYQNNSQNDNGSNVGQAGNASAYANYLKYQQRNVCSNWILQKPQPLHPERFARVEGISVEQSRALFDVIKQANLLDANNYLVVSPSSIEADYNSHPEKYPAIQALPKEVVDDIFGQLGAVYTVHTFRSDYNGSALYFTNNLCQAVSGISLIVDNGYGGGTINEGKQVHVWAKEESSKVFSHWTGDTDLLESPLEYHTSLVMPGRNVHITANYYNLLPYMEFDNRTIKGGERNKKIYTYFPAKDKIKGVVWLFHGTNGNAISWVNDIETGKCATGLWLWIMASLPLPVKKVNSILTLTMMEITDGLMALILH